MIVIINNNSMELIVYKSNTVKLKYTLLNPAK